MRRLVTALTTIGLVTGVVVIGPGAGAAVPACDIVGTSGDDVLVGTDASEVICGLGGDDHIRGGGGSDIILGGPGDDVIFGGRGHDRIDSGSGHDTVDGQHGRDRIYGRSGDDRLVGGRGRDRLRGGVGTDSCTDLVGPINMRSCEQEPHEESADLPTGELEIVDVGGILVSAVIAPDVSALLTAAAADGFDLGGGGFRDPAVQVALRRTNCGTSEYAIWEMPAHQCNPPTAIPGRSQHELGLAIDFTHDGRLISSTDDPAYIWLEANAARFGLFVHPAEPWHWSTTGN